MRRDRIGPPCRGSGRRTSPSCAPVNPFCHPLRARGPGRGLPAATGSLANAIGRAKTAEDPLTPSVTPYTREGQRVVCPLLRGRSPTRSVAPQQPRTPVHPFCHPLRARGPGRGLPAATGSLANAIGRAKTAEGLGRAFSPAFRARVWAPKNLARRVLIYWFRRRDEARRDQSAMPRIGPANLAIVRPR